MISKKALFVVGQTLALWAAQAGLSYLGLPLSGELGLLFGLLYLGAYATVILVSLGLAIRALFERAWLRSAAVVVVAVSCALAVASVDWAQAFVRHQVSWHRGDLRSFAAAFERGALRDGARLPRSLRPLSSDDRAHVWSVDRFADNETPVLVIQTWQDWRAENGVGLAYLPPGSDVTRMVRTAEGDGAHPVHELGEGWWWVE